MPTAMSSKSLKLYRPLPGNDRLPYVRCANRYDEAFTNVALTHDDQAFNDRITSACRDYFDEAEPQGDHTLPLWRLHLVSL